MSHSIRNHLRLKIDSYDETIRRFIPGPYRLSDGARKSFWRKNSRSASRYWAISIRHAWFAVTRTFFSSHHSLKRRSSVELALGTSWRGSLFGGFLEYTAAMAMGLKNMHLIAAGLYALSVPCRRWRGV